MSARNEMITAGCGSEIVLNNPAYLVAVTDDGQTTTCGVAECPMQFAGGESVDTAKTALGQCILGNYPEA